MKNIGYILLAALLVSMAAQAAQDTEITIREVRNPNTLAAYLNANAADAESRLTSGSSSADKLDLINANDAGTAYLTLQADKADDAGDKYGIIASDGAGMLIQSDKDSKGTLATKLTVGNTGILTMKGGATLDNTTSATALTITETTVAIVGNATVSGTATGDDLAATDDCTVGDDLAVTGLATVGETLAVTGVATFTAESVHNLGIDADYITVDGGASGGIDTKSAATLMVGESTADKVEIADAAVETEIQGTLDVHGDADFNEQITVDLDAADEEIVITQSAAAHSEGVPLIFINDDATGATATESDEATMEIDSEGVYALTISDGALAVESVIETAAAGALVLAPAVATSVDIGSVATCTDIQLLSDGGTMDIGSTASTFLFTSIGTNPSMLIGADAAGAADTVLDTTGAGTITVGSADVTAITLTSTAVAVGGTLEVTGVATLTAAPVFVATNAPGTATCLMTNAPACTEETPVWITVTVGGNAYTMPAWLTD